MCSAQTLYYCCPAVDGSGRTDIHLAFQPPINTSKCCKLIRLLPQFDGVFCTTSLLTSQLNFGTRSIINQELILQGDFLIGDRQVQKVVSKVPNDMTTLEGGTALFILPIWGVKWSHCNSKTTIQRQSNKSCSCKTEKAKTARLRVGDDKRSQSERASHLEPKSTP